MPERARLFWAEDSSEIMEMGIEFAERAGHKVVVTARTLDEALSQVSSMGDKGIQVAVVDGNLRPSVSTGSDGKMVAEAIKKSFPGIGIIGNSSGSVIGADIQVPKFLGPSAIIKAITAMPSPFSR